MQLCPGWANSLYLESFTMLHLYICTLFLGNAMPNYVTPCRQLALAWFRFDTILRAQSIQ
uniref:Uncharacterized protein n=1 Tax=Anguilla anguilla TaxID=7936 RepID=A0A0E9QTX9_ANGAN